MSIKSTSLILDKILLRSLVAAIAPVTLYTLGFLIASQFYWGGEAEYFNQSAWMVIAEMPCIYPVNLIGLAMLFKPVDYVIYLILKIDRNKRFEGNFAPKKEESQNYELVNPTSGKVLTDINGVYLRNGPNVKFFTDNKRGHFFDGASMIHGIRIKNGKAYYCNRYT